MEPVGIGRRAVAVLIDTILLFVVGYVIAALTGGTTAQGFEITGAPFFFWLAVALAYYTAMEAMWGFRHEVFTRRGSSRPRPAC